MAFSNIGFGQTSLSGTNATDTATETVPSLGSERIGWLLVLEFAGAEPTGVTWDGNTMSNPASAFITNGNYHASLWYIIGSTHNQSVDAVVTWASSAPKSGMLVMGWADAASEISLDDSDEATGTTQNPSITTTPTESNDLVISGSSSSANANSGTPVSGCTVMEVTSPGGNSMCSAYSQPSLSGDETHTHNYSQSGSYAIFAAAFKEAAANASPTVALNTADNASLTTLAALDFTGTDTEGDDIRYNIQISDNPDGWASGSELEDSSESTGLYIHPQPTGGTDWEGNNQLDDRPGQSFTGNGGVLDKISLRLNNDQGNGSYPDGTAYIRLYRHAGTYGSSSTPEHPAIDEDTPTPGWIAQSDAVVLTSAMGTSDAWYDFDFSSADRVRLKVGVKYMWVLQWQPNDTDIENTFSVRGDADTVTNTQHDGNAYIDGDSPNHGVQDTYDMDFRVYESYVLLDKVSGTDSGFSGSPDNTDPYTSGQQVTFTVQSGDELETGATYYWRVRGIDPSGSNSYGDWTTSRTFTIDGSLLIPPPPARHMLRR